MKLIMSNLINTSGPLDENLINALRNTIYNPPECKERVEPDYETCERIMRKGMYAGKTCHYKRVKQLENGKWYCEMCSKLPKGLL